MRTSYVVLLLVAGCALNTKGELASRDALPEPDGFDGFEWDFPPDFPDTQDMEVEETDQECERDSDCSDMNACNGVEFCDPMTLRCLAGAPREDGTVCGDAPRKICIDSACVESQCGDMFVDRGGGEFCDDGNDVPDDGCHACRRTCGSDDDCLDDEICNGTETCDTMENECRGGAPLEDGRECSLEPKRICLGQVCSLSICGDGFVDTGIEEECEGGDMLTCTAPCGTEGAHYCSSCRWGGCVPPHELCNGEDDDCDDAIDEDFDCFPGQLDVACATTCGSTGSGTCTEACMAPGTEECRVPAEACNGADDNCDTICDDGFTCCAGRLQACQTACGSTGTGACTDACELPGPDDCAIPVETCNGVDDDCDTVCDNGWACCAGAVDGCTTACGSTGTRTCTGSCGWGGCVVPEEICNGLDDDCDGELDDGFDCVMGDSRTCTASCGSSGTQTCNGACVWSGCDPPAEICNGVDDDCDGSRDEDFECVRGEVGVFCTTECGSTGSGVCSMSCELPGPGECSPPTEICNGADDDCDTLADDTFACVRGALQTDCITCGGTGAAAGTRTCLDTCNWSVCCAQIEYCNGCDDDCNGVSDEPGWTGSDLRVTEAAGNSVYPTLVSNPADGEYGLAWTDERDGDPEIYFARISTDAVKLSTDIKLTDNSNVSARQSLVFSTSNYGVAWHDNRDANWEIYLATFDTDGANFSSSRLTNNMAASLYPSLTWTGSHYGIAWQDSRDAIVTNEIYFALTDDGRNKIGGDIRVTDVLGEALTPVALFSGTGFMIGYNSAEILSNEIFVSSLTISGGVGSSQRITDASGVSVWPAMTFTGSEYGITWLDERNDTTEIFFTRLSAAGSEIGEDRRVSPAAVGDSDREVISAAWSGTEYSLAWTDDRDGVSKLYFTRLNREGGWNGPNEKIINATGVSTYPSLVWANGQWAVAWQDGRDGNMEIYFAVLGCVPPP